jgi:hypothetical protein
MGENVVDQRQLRSGSEVVVGRLSPHAAFHDALLCDMLAFVFSTAFGPAEAAETQHR